MKTIISKKTYDTEDSAKIGSKCVGDFGQPDGYEEQLFETKDGFFFLYGVGGENSPYAKPAIKRASKKVADAWRAENGC
ncbi:MAG: hypothetical protein FWC70_04645 [Defluviitaleaceae bacterium]|nr:hypothetical protein [Defluviitaleaceae bacterium]